MMRYRMRIPKPPKILAFFNNKGGVGKTTLVYHLAWTFADQGMRVLMADLDPQSNLTAMCMEQDALEELWPDENLDRQSMRGAVEPIIDGTGDIQEPHVEDLSSQLALIPGDIRLAEFEQKLSDAWPRCMDRDPASFRVVSSIYRVIQKAAVAHRAELVLMDVGPNLGALNRAALIAADDMVTPLGADLFSIQGLRNLGPVLEQWREQWQERLAKNPVKDLDLPLGTLKPLGYIVMQPNLYGGEVTRAYERWLKQIPGEYSRSVLMEQATPGLLVDGDPFCLGVLRHYRSLMPMAQTAQKPIFKLTAADGAIGAHARAARMVGDEFQELGQRVLKKLYPED